MGKNKTKKIFFFLIFFSSLFLFLITPVHFNQLKASDDEAVINYLRYPGFQLATKEVFETMAEEDLRESESLGAIVEDYQKWKEDFANKNSEITDENPKYYGITSKTVMIFYLGKEKEIEKISNWFIRAAEEKGWKLFRKEITDEFPDKSTTPFCNRADSCYSLLFGKGNNGGGLTVDIQPVVICDDTFDRYYDIWKMIVVNIDIDKLNEDNTPQQQIQEGCRAFYDIPPSVVSCNDPPEIIAERNDIKADIKAKTGIDVVDSDYCDEENPPWSKESLFALREILTKLPSCFLETANMQTISGLMKKSQGKVDSLINQALEQSCQQTAMVEGKMFCTIGSYLFLNNEITICDEHWKIKSNPYLWLQGVIVHELAHALQQNGARPSFARKLPSGAYTNKTVIEWLQETGWAPDGLCPTFVGCSASLETPSDLPTAYARETKDPKEDMAESVRLYVTDPQELLRISPRRYDFVKDKIMCGTVYGQ